MASLAGFDKRGIAKARLRGERNRSNDAILLAFVPSTNQIHLKLRNHTEIRIPVQSVAGLREVSKADLRHMKLSRVGDAIEIPEYDVNVSVPGIVRKAVFGEDPYARAGRARSKAKAVAARVNGRKGGRPKARALLVAWT
jgi:uncharacterized protein DUF2442